MEGQTIVLIVPLALIQLTLAVIALVDWAKRATYRTLPKWGWFVVILIAGIVGPALYLTFGRGEERTTDDGRHSD